MPKRLNAFGRSGDTQSNPLPPQPSLVDEDGRWSWGLLDGERNRDPAYVLCETYADPIDLSHLVGRMVIHDHLHCCWFKDHSPNTHLPREAGGQAGSHPRSRRRAFFRKHPELIPEHVHGTMNGYNNYCCRCPQCKRVAQDRNRQVYLEKKAKTNKWFDNALRWEEKLPR